MLLHCLVSMNFGLFGVPKTIQKWTPNHVLNRLPFRPVFSAQLGPIWGSFSATQIRPKIACWAVLAHLAALEVHLGGPRSSTSQFGLLRRPFGALRGGHLHSILAFQGPISTLHGSILKLSLAHWEPFQSYLRQLTFSRSAVPKHMLTRQCMI